MEGQKQEEKAFTSTKVELTEEMKSMPIEDLEKYGLSSYHFSTIKGLGINTLGDLLACNTDELYNATKTEYYSEYWSIRKVIMKMGLLFNDDHIKFEEAGISDEIALISVDKLALSPRLKNTLSKRGNIHFLGDLLTIDYKSILRIRTMGEDGIIELKKYLHSLGYSMQNEEPILKEIVEKFKQKGIPMVHESLGLDGRTAGVLYRNGIYTLEDLLNFGERVFELVGMGDLKTKNLKEAMEARNIHFGTIVSIPQESPVAIRPSEIIVQRLKSENATIKERVDRKEELASEYDKLIAEREKLIAREKSLDEEIAKKIALLQNSQVKEEGSSYGRR